MVSTNFFSFCGSRRSSIEPILREGSSSRFLISAWALVEYLGDGFQKKYSLRLPDPFLPGDLDLTEICKVLKVGLIVMFFLGSWQHIVFLVPLARLCSLQNPCTEYSLVNLQIDWPQDGSRLFLRHTMKHPSLSQTKRTQKSLTEKSDPVSLSVRIQTLFSIFESWRVKPSGYNFIVFVARDTPFSSFRLHTFSRSWKFV